MSYRLDGSRRLRVTNLPFERPVVDVTFDPTGRCAHVAVSSRSGPDAGRPSFLWDLDKHTVATTSGTVLLGMVPLTGADHGKVIDLSLIR